MRRVRRTPLRLQITLAFAASAAVLFVALGVFLHQRLGEELDASLRSALSQRADDLARQAGGDDMPELARAGRGERGDDIAQVLDRAGRVATGTPGFGEQPLLSGSALDRARGATTTFERVPFGDDGPATLVASPVGSSVVVVGTALEGRDEALANLDQLLLIGVPVAVVLASLLGYLVAGRALTPVERLRRQAEAIGAGDLSRRLAQPPAQDEVRRLAETLNGMLERIEAGFERERTFVADASHELRTPLARLKAELELARRPGRAPAALRDAVDSSAAEVDHLARLADDLLTLTRADHGGLPVRREHVALSAVVAAAAARTGVTGRLRVTGDLPETVYVDPVRLQQALGNLFDNARRHGTGAVTLATGEEGRDMLLSVADEGGGIPAPLRATAFERFTRADAARAAGGTGLGLAIVAAVAAGHGGAAWVGTAGEVRMRIADAL